jgi:hypothetical protein
MWLRLSVLASLDQLTLPLAAIRAILSLSGLIPLG